MQHAPRNNDMSQGRGVAPRCLVGFITTDFHPLDPLRTDTGLKQVTRRDMVLHQLISIRLWSKSEALPAKFHFSVVGDFKEWAYSQVQLCTFYHIQSWILFDIYLHNMVVSSAWVEEPAWLLEQLSYGAVQLFLTTLIWHYWLLIYYIHTYYLRFNIFVLFWHKYCYALSKAQGLPL